MLFYFSKPLKAKTNIYMKWLLRVMGCNMAFILNEGIQYLDIIFFTDIMCIEISALQAHSTLWSQARECSIIEWCQPLPPYKAVWLWLCQDHWRVVIQKVDCRNTRISRYVIARDSSGCLLLCWITHIWHCNHWNTCILFEFQSFWVWESKFESQVVKGY